MMKMVASTLVDDMFREINNGTPSCYGVKREPSLENYLILCTQRKMMQITQFYLRLEGPDIGHIQYSKEDFQGRLVLDTKGSHSARARVLLLNEADTVLVATDFGIVQGKIIIVANPAVGADKPSLFGINVVLTQDCSGGKSSILRDSSPDLTSHWSLEAELAEHWNEHYA